MSETPPLLSDQGAADLAPLRNSHEADQLEAELKGLFMAMFAQFVRPGLDAVATVGAPHLGDLDQLERAVKMDGIALQRSDDADAMRYLHKAFRARNPKRGLHMLRAYLRALFGDGNWELSQLWQDASMPYPAALDDSPGAGRYLTARIHARVVSSGIARTPELMAQAFRSVLPARMLLTVSLIAYPFDTRSGVFIAASAAAESLQFTGEFVDPLFRLKTDSTSAGYMASTASAERLIFTGTFA